MIIKKNRPITGVLIILMGLLSLCTFSNCAQQKPKETSMNDAMKVLKEHAIKSNPALRGKKMRVNVAIDGGLSVDGVCACIQVCDGNGQNCTACSCSPANCGSCN